MSVGANFLFPVVFPVTTPDYLTIWIVAVPNLAAKGSATTSANQSVRKKALGAGVTAFSLSPFHFQLYQIEYLPADNPRMAVFYKNCGTSPLLTLAVLVRKSTVKIFWQIYRSWIQCTMLCRHGAFFAAFVLTPRDNGDGRDKIRSALLFASAVSMFFGVSQQIQKSKRRNSQQISTTLRVVNAKIIGIFCNNNCC